jgi:hypothetical protein
MTVLMFVLVLAAPLLVNAVMEARAAPADHARPAAESGAASGPRVHS